MKILAENRKAKFDYQILERLEAGLILNGQEVKSIKSGKASLKSSFIVFKKTEPYLINTDILPYQPKNAPKDYDSTRARKVLLKKKEINYLLGKSQQKGLTIVPLKLYTTRGKIKVEIAVGKGKHKADKRETIKKRETEREIQRDLKEGG